jgi:DNA-directed RNA polymerase specialized sigma24 family protein
VTNPRAIDRPRRAMRALSDAALIAAMREGSSDAWQEFLMRFQPLLERFGLRMRMPRSEWRAAVLTVLEDAAIRWAMDDAVLPTNMAAYLLRAASFHRMTLERDAERRATRYDLATMNVHREGVVVSLCSEAAVRDSDPTDADEGTVSGVTRFCTLLRETLTEHEEHLLARVGDGLPYREIAAMLEVNYETAKKRVQRLCAKVRDRVPWALEQLSSEDRIQAERLLMRLQSPRRKGGQDDDV